MVNRATVKRGIAGAILMFTIAFFFAAGFTVIYSLRAPLTSLEQLYICLTTGAVFGAVGAFGGAVWK